MKKKSAGILVYRIKSGLPEVVLVHPGGPYFAKKDIGSWSIPKGEFTEDEAPLDAAKREFLEETGIELHGTFTELSPIVQKGGKTVFAWAIEQDIDVSEFKSNTFKLEWPPKSGQYKEFPEIDKVEWFAIHTARQKINSGQIDLLDQLVGFSNENK